MAKEEKRQRELLDKEVFKIVVKAPVLEPGVDPKSVYCPYHKAKQCTRGEKCKYSHDPQVGRKGAKLDVYQDRREKVKNEETNEDWDEETLQNVVATKGKGQKIQSNIICKFFIDAVRDRKYGWFWECPNGELCHYKHALPPGFVLEKKKRRGDEEEVVDETPIEDLLEEERQKLGGQGTPVTLELFTEWKNTREKRRQQETEAAASARTAQIAAGRAQNLTGRELLQYRPELFNDTEDPGEEDFDYGALRRQLLEEEDLAAEASVSKFKSDTAHLDMKIDESLFDDVEDLPSSEEEATVAQANKGGNDNNE